MQSIQQRSVLDTKRLLERLALKEGMRVADLGSGGHDYYIKHVAHKVGDSGTVYIVDVRPEPLSVLHSTCVTNGFKHVVPIHADIEMAEGVSLPDEHCDRVLLINTLHQLNDPVHALREASRLLNKTGILAVVDWHSSGLLGPTGGQFVMSDRIVEAAESAGLVLSQHFDASPNHHGLIFIKA